MTASEAVVIHTDGASRGNPGPAAIGVVIEDPAGHVLAEFGEALDATTNNVAEYTAVIRALERARQLGAKRVRCLMDSQLVVRQLNGSYRVKHVDMLPLYRRVLELVQQFDEVAFAHVPREQNTEADRLANLALDRRTEVPEGIVDGFFQALIHHRWDEAERLMAADFRYRRASRSRDLDGDAFLALWRKAAASGWRAPTTRSFGADVLLETRATGAHEVAVIWICSLAGAQVESVLEYRDGGS